MATSNLSTAIEMPLSSLHDLYTLIFGLYVLLILTLCFLLDLKRAIPDAGRYYWGLNPRRSHRHRERSLYRRPSRDTENDSGDEYAKDNSQTQRRRSFRQYDQQLKTHYKYLERGIARVIFYTLTFTLAAYIISISCGVPVLGTIASGCRLCRVGKIQQHDVDITLDTLFFRIARMPDASSYRITSHMKNPYELTGQGLEDVAIKLERHELKNRDNAIKKLYALINATQPLPNLLRSFDRQVEGARVKLNNRAGNIYDSLPNTKNRTATADEKRTVVHKFFKEITNLNGELEMLYNKTYELERKLNDIHLEYTDVNITMPSLPFWIANSTNIGSSKNPIVDAFRTFQEHYKKNWQELRVGLAIVQETKMELDGLTKLYNRGAVQISGEVIDHLISRFQNEYPGVQEELLSLNQKDTPKRNILQKLLFK